MDAENKSGVGGDPLLSCLFTSLNKLGADVRLAERALNNGWVSFWKITPERKAAIMARIDGLMSQCEDAEQLAKLSELQRKMASDDVKTLETLVKLLRLVEGQSTENVDHDVRTRIIVERRGDVRMPEPGDRGAGGGDEGTP